jgi:DNA-binding NtrC family response regulator
MRLLIVGTLKGQLTNASKLAMDKGTSVTHAQTIDQALAVLRSGRGADLLMVDVALDIRDLVLRLDAERIAAPIVACGISNDARAAVAAIHAGAKEYIPLPPDPELIAAILAAVTNNSRELVYRDETMAHVVKLAQRIAPSDASVLITGESGTGKEVVARDEIGIDGILTPDGMRLDQARNPLAVAHAALAAETVTRALVGRTVADVERDLILETLKHCLGNRTHAANILGISIRTLRNKLNEYSGDGVPVPPPGAGEARLAG